MTFPFTSPFGFVDHLQQQNEYIYGAMNNNPLEFNSGKRREELVEQSILSPSDGLLGRPPEMEKEIRIMDNQIIREESNDAGPPAGLSNGNNLPNLWAGMMGGYPMVGMNMIMDPNGMMPTLMPPMMVSQGDPNASAPLMQQSTNISENNMLLPSSGPGKEIIHCKSCTLFPPNPNALPPTTRERPPGCRTVFVGGLPDNMTEEIIMEVFQRCGDITTLRLSKKTFCHIRFSFENSVDAAMFLSGYRVRIGSNSDAANAGRLHVDFAQARDDQYEWECKQRQFQREQRHRVRLEEERLRPTSPLPVVHYTDNEAAAISEKIKLEETFPKAVQVIITWLERGDCTKRNVTSFYSMIQSTNSHIRRLLNEKTLYEEELQKAKEILKGRMQGVLLQFSHIERLFVAACHKKVWDHFSKAQRKNIEIWKRQSSDIKLAHADYDAQKDDDEMDMSDGDDQQPNVSMMARKRIRSEDGLGSIYGLGGPSTSSYVVDENIAVRCQMEAYKNEIEVIRAEMQANLSDKDKQLKILHQTVQNLQQQLLDAKRKQHEDESRLKELQSKAKAPVELQQRNEDLSADRCESGGGSGTNNSLDLAVSDNISTLPVLSASTMTENEAKLIGIISTFLNVHPFGAGLDYIWSYVSKLEASIRPSDLEVLMSKFPNVFNQKLVGIGANIERRWLFIAFNNSTCI